MSNSVTNPSGDSAQIRDPWKGVDGGPIVKDSKRLGIADKLPYPPHAPGEPTSKAGKSI